MRAGIRTVLLAGAVGIALGAAAQAQDTGISFGGLTQDTDAPVEVAADTLDVNQADGTAVFSGNVLVTQGELRLSAARVQVVYAAGDGSSGRIEELLASGGVTIANATEAAEGQDARYNIDAGSVVMTGDVVLTQGATALSGNSLTIDLNTGTGRMEGRVRTIFQTGDN